MSVRSAQSITKEFTTRAFASGAATNADSTPTGTLFVNGTSNAAAVTVTNQATGRYKAAVTLPTLSYGDLVELLITATVSSVTDSAVVWYDSKDIAFDASGQVEIQASDVTITVVAPTVQDDGTFEIIQGDDYLITDARSINFTIGASPDLTGATVQLRIQGEEAGDVVTGSCTVTGAGTSTQVIKAELTAANTATLPAQDCDYDLQVTDTDGHIMTVVQGLCIVSEQVA
jgi:hypothetical protein